MYQYGVPENLENIQKVYHEKKGMPRLLIGT